MHHAELEERGDDDSEAVALESPTETLTDLGTRIKHAADEHESGSHRAFGGAEKETEND